MTTAAFTSLETLNGSKASRLSSVSTSLALPPSYERLPNQTPQANRPSHRTWPWLVVATVVVLVVAVQQPWKALTSQQAAAEMGKQHESAKVVTVVHPEQATSSNVVLPATIRSWQTTTLHARVSGYLTAWHRDLGAHVKTGELLAEIDTPELDQELAEGEALAREAEAAAVQASAERIEAQADLKVAEAQLVRAEAEAALAKSQLNRREQLFLKQVITREEYDTYHKDLEARMADVAAAKSDLSRRRTNLETRAATIKAREATAKSRRSNVDRLNELQAFKRIVAPFDGIVTRRNAEVGMLVTAGKEFLFTLEDMSRVRVQVNVPQTYSLQTVAGANVTVHVPESSTQPTPASITRISNSVDSASRTMLAEIELDNASHLYQPGSYAQVSLATTQSESNWMIPTNTLSMRVDGPHIAVVNARNQIELKLVTLGRDLGRSVVVTNGVQGNERLIVNPSDSLSNGLQVQVDAKSNSPSAGVASLTLTEKGPG